VKSIAPALAALALLATACGGDGGSRAAAPSRTVEIEMVDTAFQSDTISVERGERIRFVFHNRGKLPHDAFIGDTEAQAKHEREMRKAEGKHHGGKGEGVTVQPGKTGKLVHTFDEAGTVEIGCHQPGHYAAGMKLDVTVA
jgi:uncharacterized cupredoxin-like copper-binding protein